MAFCFAVRREKREMSLCTPSHGKFFFSQWSVQANRPSILLALPGGIGMRVAGWSDAQRDRSWAFPLRPCAWTCPTYFSAISGLFVLQDHCSQGFKNCAPVRQPWWNSLALAPCQIHEWASWAGPPEQALPEISPLWGGPLNLCVRGHRRRWLKTQVLMES